jgi:hypothetical protein
MRVGRLLLVHLGVLVLAMFAHGLYSMLGYARFWPAHFRESWLLFFAATFSLAFVPLVLLSAVLIVASRSGNAVIVAVSSGAFAFLVVNRHEISDLFSAQAPWIYMLTQAFALIAVLPVLAATLDGAARSSLHDAG